MLQVFQLFSILVVLSLFAVNYCEENFSPFDKIHIALTIDETSSKDLLIVANSVVLSAYYPLSLVFHIVACGRNMSDANILAAKVKKSLENCMPHIALDIQPFMLPLDSGFALQRDHVSAEKRSHWFSPTGADMARFFLASIFPNVDKLLYLDNDIVVSCCVEEVYRTPLNDNQIAGIVLDDLKWATVTQFQRQYNASHPLVIKNIRRGKSNDGSPVTEDEFWKALPKYPNDGVLLIDVKKYNRENILDKASEIALANARGDYVVGMGTQQFTVLMLHDRWVELTPRGNIRHFPDMARGFLMWFYYNGIIHYAGMAKPRVVCNAGNSDNEHRIGSYTPWATTVHALIEQCPSEPLIADVKTCADHIPVPGTWGTFLELVQAVARYNADAALIVLHIGSIHSNDTSSSDYISAMSSNVVINTHAEDNGSKYPRNGRNSHQLLSAMSSILRYVLFHAPWSMKIFDADEGRLASTKETLHRAFSSSEGDLNITSLIKEVAVRRKLRGKTPRKSWTDATHKAQSKRNYRGININLCDGSNDYSQYSARDATCSGDKDSFVASYEQNGRVNAYESKEACKSVLQHIKANGNKHWDVIGVTIDYQPTASRPLASSLGVLRNLDLVFMRPKFVVVKIGSPQLHLTSNCNPRGHRTILDDAKEAQRILQRNGYQAVIDPTNSCDSSDKIGHRHRKFHDRKSEHSHDGFVCVWGTRITTIELGGQERWA